MEKIINLSPISLNEVFPIDNSNPIVFVNFGNDEENAIVSAIRLGDDGSSVNVKSNFSMTGNWLQMHQLFLPELDDPKTGHYEVAIEVQSPTFVAEKIKIVQDVVQ